MIHIACSKLAIKTKFGVFTFNYSFFISCMLSVFTGNVEHDAFHCCWVYRTKINTEMFFITLNVKNVTGKFSKLSEIYLLT